MKRQLKEQEVNELESETDKTDIVDFDNFLPEVLAKRASMGNTTILKIQQLQEKFDA